MKYKLESIGCGHITKQKWSRLNTRRTSSKTTLTEKNEKQRGKNTLFFCKINTHAYEIFLEQREKNHDSDPNRMDFDANALVHIFFVAIMNWY